MSDHREAIAEVLFRWNTPDDPYFVIRGRIGETSEADPYLPIADALLGSDVLAQIRAEARAEALREAADEIEHSVMPDHSNAGYRDGHAHAAWVVRSLIDHSVEGSV